MAIARQAGTLLDFQTRGLVDSFELAAAGLSTVLKGDLVIGDGTTFSSDFAGIAQADYASATTKIAFRTRGAVQLSVEGKNMSDSNTAILVGDALFWDSSNTAIHVAGDDGDLYLGRAMEPVASGATTVIGIDFNPSSLVSAVSATGTSEVLGFFIDDLSNIANADEIVHDYIPGYAGTIEAMWFVTGATPASTASKDIDLQTYVDDGSETNTTGGLMTMLTANVDAQGEVLLATAITALNIFADDDKIGVKCTQATAAFSEGNGTVFIRLARTHTH